MYKSLSRIKSPYIPLFGDADVILHRFIGFVGHNIRFVLDTCNRNQRNSRNKYILPILNLVSLISMRDYGDFQIKNVATVLEHHTMPLVVASAEGLGGPFEPK